MLKITRWREGGRKGGREGGREGGGEGGREVGGEVGEMSDKDNSWRNKEGSHKNTLSHMTKHVLVQTLSYSTPKYQAF